MPRAPKRTFKALSAGATGSSTNLETIARNKRRQRLNPLQAEYERARANRGNRISSKIKRLKKTAAYINAFDDEERRCIEQGIRGVEEAVYRADKVEIARLFAEREGAVGAASAGKAVVGSEQLGAKLCIVVPAKDARTTVSAEGLEAVAATEEEDEDAGEGGMDDSASYGPFGGISFSFEAASEIEENVDTDDTIVDLGEGVSMTEEGAEEISSIELRRRIRQDCRAFSDVGRIGCGRRS